MPTMKKNEMEFVSAELVRLLSSPPGSASGILSAQGPEVGQPTSGSTACTNFTCLWMGFVLRSEGWDPWVSPGRHCSVFWENNGCICPPLHHTSWCIPAYF